VIKLLKGLKNILDPNWWAEKIGWKSGLYQWSMKSSLREWALGLKGWKWWAWQLGSGLLFLIVVELLLNQIGMTILPW
jgi:hypothetical protein|tara:strand:- start:69 stop:302 length:234 start_codon:yes stop_codon:yes gene_type:complete